MPVSLSGRLAPGGFAPSRRGFIVGCAGLATAIGATVGGARSTETQQRLSGDSFAFTAPDRPDVVFAVTLPAHPFGQTDSEALTVRLHAGGSAWTIGPFALIPTVGVSSNGVRIFSGKVRQLWSSGESAAHLIAVATPAQELEKSRLGVWAEVISARGIRARIGNPTISHLLEEAGQLAGLQGQLGPTRVRPLLPAALARQIAERGGGHAGPDNLPRANRLVAQLLPDTLEFDPSRPGGFTFAAMNGRKPGDAIDPIVKTILAGAPRRGDATKRYATANQFPYFVTAGAA
jgi:hypothetical protein